MTQEDGIHEGQLVAALHDEARTNPDFIRDRGLQDYSYFLDVHPSIMARNLIERNGTFRWYDMCSGTFQAGQELGSRTSPQNRERLEAIGIDLDTPEPGGQSYYDGAVRIERGNVVNHPLPKKADLITCVNGLYLVEKYMGFPAVAKALEHWYEALKVGGTLAVMRELCLRGGNRPFSVAELLKQQLGDAVEIKEPHPMMGVEFHSYVKIVKPNDLPLQLVSE